MLIIPAIDLLDSKVVRLKKGNMQQYTVYSENPVDTALRFQNLGVNRLHIVDLDGAKEGRSVNFDIIEAIVRATGMDIEVGGGIRNKERVSRYFNLGVKYAILGTVAIKQPALTKEIALKYPEKIILGLDAREGVLSSEGWYEDSNLTVMDLLDEYRKFPFESIIYTDILRDGMLSGINMEWTKKVAEYSDFKIIASGGLKGEKDIDELKNIKNVGGVIVGKAFYEGFVDLKSIIDGENNYA